MSAGVGCGNRTCPRPAKPVAAAHNARLVSSAETPTYAAFRVATRARPAGCGLRRRAARRGSAARGARATVAEQLVDDRHAWS